MPLIRDLCPRARVGLVNNLEWIEPASDHIEDQAAATRWDGAFNRWFLDPVFGRGYPADMLAWYGHAAPRVEPGDFEAMAVPTDFLGVNYYTRRVIAHDPAPRDASERTFLSARQIYWPFVPRAEFDEWEVAPEGLYRTLLRVQRDYRPASIYITENGTTGLEGPGADGAVHDLYRTRYLARHTAAVHQAIADGVNARGYFVWSLVDNYEWAFGFTKRFGVIHVDHATQRRTVKDSGHWYGRTARANGFPLSDANATL